MYKSKLQELCQRRSLGLPEYSSVKDGPDHTPRFIATVSIQGRLLATSTECKSSKEAQNTAAKFAIDRLSAPIPPPQPLEHPHLPPISPPPAAAPASQNPQLPNALAAPVDQPHSPAGEIPVSPLPSSVPAPTPGLLTAKSAKARPVNGNGEIGHQSWIGEGSNDKTKKDTLHIYKNQLQQFLQKNNLGLPVYTYEHEGPPHDRRFKSCVTFENKSYKTSCFFPTLKEAEQAAAKVACEMLVDVAPEDGGLYKNLLQEFVQKREMKLPTYETNSFGMPHTPLFVSTVEVGGLMFRGEGATNKKQAEVNAAKVAYRALMESDPAGPAAEHSNAATSVVEDIIADNFSKIIHSNSVMKKHQNPTAEENPAISKRAKSSQENTDLIADNSAHDVSILSGEGCEASALSKTVVCPRSVKLPEGAALLPYSDEQWVAFTVKSKQEPTSQV